MDPNEIQAKATIAAALIVTHAVDVPSIPKHCSREARIKPRFGLRELTEYVYQAIVGDTAYDGGGAGVDLAVFAEHLLAC